MENRETFFRHGINFDFFLAATRQSPDQGMRIGMWLLLLLILAVLVFGVWGAVKVAFWVLLIALAVAIIAGFLGRGLFVRRSSL